MNWKPGDVGVLIDGPRLATEEKKYVGTIVEVRSTPYADYDGVETVDIAPLNHVTKVETAYIRPLPPDDEDLSQDELMKIASWDDCIWQPQELVVVNEQ